LPRGAYRAMKELIAGRIRKDGRPVSEVLLELFFEGLAGNVILAETTSGKGSVTLHYVSPAIFLKILLDYMLKSRELAFKIRDAKTKEKGTGGGIRIVLPSVPADPLVKPGQNPRPLRLLGQDPSKPFLGDAPDAKPSVTADGSGAARPIKEAGSTAAPVIRDGPATAAKSPEDDFAELVEPEDPPQPCHKCDGWGKQRIGFGVKTEPCDRCGGTGTCSGLEKKWDTLVPCEICRHLGRV
jgi:hypothetical protein